MRHVSRPFLAALLVFLGVPVANADSIILDEPTFASLGGLQFESFEGLAASSSATSIDAGPFTVSSTTRFVQVREEPFGGMVATDGEKYVEWRADSGGGTVVFTFDAPATMFGLMLTNLWKDVGLTAFQNPRIGLSTNGGTYFDPAFTVPSLGDGMQVFIGLVADDPFTRLTLTNFAIHASLDFGGPHPVPFNIGMDEIRFNVVETSPVPEPTSLLLFAVGAAGLFAKRRSHSRRQP